MSIQAAVSAHRRTVLALAPAPAASTDAQAGVRNWTMDGTAADAAYRGGDYDQVVELPCGVRLTGIFDRAAHPRGAGVRLLLDPQGCFAFPDPNPVRRRDPTSTVPTSAVLASDALTSPARTAALEAIRTTLEV